jgi:hypothetical protein
MRVMIESHAASARKVISQHRSTRPVPASRLRRTEALFRNGAMPLQVARKFVGGQRLE